MYAEKLTIKREYSTRWKE